MQKLRNAQRGQQFLYISLRKNFRGEGAVFYVTLRNDRSLIWELKAAYLESLVRYGTIKKTSID